MMNKRSMMSRIIPGIIRKESNGMKNNPNIPIAINAVLNSLILISLNRNIFGFLNLASQDVL